MRTARTQDKSDQLTRAYRNSGMSSLEFVEYLEGTRDIFDVTKQADYISFHVVQDECIHQFYWYATQNTWLCKS